MQQRGTRDSPRELLGWRMALNNLRLRIERIQLAAQARTERDGAGVSRTHDEVISQ
ncbi:hypothetical protein D3C87_1834110 [compost metagenome]